MNATKEVMSRLGHFEIHQLPREKNSNADWLAKLASSMMGITNKRIIFLTVGQPEISRQEIQVLYAQPKLPFWNNDIIKFLSDGQLPTDPMEAWKLRARAARFLLFNKELYKCGFFLPYLKCQVPPKADYVLRKIHEGIYGNHLSERALVGKVLY